MTNEYRNELIPLSTESAIKTTCPYCGVGCGVEVSISKNGAIEIRGDDSHPSNFGKLCSKGLALADTLVPDGRLLNPEINREQVSWDKALDHVASGFLDTIKKHGPDAVAFYVSGQLLTEDYYVANKLMKGFMGSANIDTNSRLCMSSSVAGHKRAFGSDTVPGCYEDLELADLVVLTGSNLAWCHPVLFQRIKTAKENNPDMRIVVVDPRKTATSSIADMHISLKPGADVALFNGLLAHLNSMDCIDEEYISQHVEGSEDTFAKIAKNVGYSDLDKLEKLTGVNTEELQRFYSWFETTEKVVTVYSQGVNQSSQGTDKVNSIINCHLATGRIGKPGMGPFSVTGQPNAMGGREVGGLANMLAAHMDLENLKHRSIVGEFWGVDKLPDKPGLKAVPLFDAIASGKIKAVWIMGTNPVVSLPNADKVKKALQDCPLVVVSDCIADTDTTRCANVLLPAQGWSEKSGTVTNSERRISRQRSFVKPAGEAKPDWWIISEVAIRMGYEKQFSYNSSRDIFVEHAALSGYKNTGDRDFDISAFDDLSEAAYDQILPEQWPVKKQNNSFGNKRFFEKGRYFTLSGKAKMLAVEHRLPATKSNKKYPLVLNTGRIRDQWHTMTRTGLSSRLSAHIPEPFVGLHPDDATRFGLVDGGFARVSSKWGQAEVRVVTTKDQPIGQLFMPLHWTGVLSSAGRVGAIIAPSTDPVSGQPELKYTPVKIRPVKYSSEALLVTSQAIELDLCAYWVAQKIDKGYAYHIASDKTPEELSVFLHSISDTAEHRQMFRFDDVNTDYYRAAVLADAQLIFAFIACKKIAQQQWDWLKAVLAFDNQSRGISSILSGIPDDGLKTGRIICACKQVGINSIYNAIRKDALTNVTQVSETTLAGTGCGSCVQELESILKDETFN